MPTGDYTPLSSPELRGSEAGRPLSRQRLPPLTPIGGRRLAGETGEEKCPELRTIGGGARGEERVIHEECLILISSQEHLLT